MKFVSAVLFVAFAVSARAGEPITDTLNKKFDAVELTGFDGQRVKIGSLPESNAVVITFLSTDCPVSNSYAPVLSELSKTYAKSGVTLRV